MSVNEFHDNGDTPVDRELNAEAFGGVVDNLCSRRDIFKKLGVGAFFASMTSEVMGSNSNPMEKMKPENDLSFKELKRTVSDSLHVPEEYDADVLIRWGDPLFSGMGEFNPATLTADEQLKRFGYNNDFVGYIPLGKGEQESSHGLLVVNHEYTDSKLMHAGSPTSYDLTEEQTRLHMEAHGLSVVEIKREAELGKWKVVLDSRYNRRITSNTEMAIAGPAMESDRMKNQFSDGVKTWGTYGNCAGSVTPWGTVLSGEENCQFYFVGNPTKTKEADHYTRMGLKGHFKENSGEYNYMPTFPWGKFDDRYNLDKTANGPLHSGWVIEIDPMSPNSIPKKRTALGRFRHEGCSVIIGDDGSVVAYTGDDQKFEYIYKFVCSKKYKEGDKAHNMTLLDEGTLYAAKFKEDKTVVWKPLVYGEGKLTEEFGFKNQGDVCIDCRKAADLLDATPMDRPEDIEVNKKTGVVYAMLTNNNERSRINKNSANPRITNLFGHIVEMMPPGKDHTADIFKWDFFILAGNPAEANNDTQYHPDTTEDGWFIAPDNCAFDNEGRIWIATDGASKFGIADGVWVSETTGPSRALSKSFLQTPTDAELCGPFFTSDNKTFFCAVQHPGEGSLYEEPSTRWPDFNPKMPPRPSVVAIQKKSGGIVGT